MKNMLQGCPGAIIYQTEHRTVRSGYQYWNVCSKDPKYYFKRACQIDPSDGSKGD